MTDPTPINVKMKMADATEVSTAVIDALRSDFAIDELFRGQADNIWRCVSLALVNTGCILIQIDKQQTPE